MVLTIHWATTTYWPLCVNWLIFPSSSQWLLITALNPPALNPPRSSHTELPPVASVAFAHLHPWASARAMLCLALDYFTFIPLTSPVSCTGNRILMAIKIGKIYYNSLNRQGFIWFENNKLSGRQAMAGRVGQRCQWGPQLSTFLLCLQPPFSWLQNGCSSASCHVRRHGSRGRKKGQRANGILPLPFTPQHHVRWPTTAARDAYEGRFSTGYIIALRKQSKTSGFY